MLLWYWSNQRTLLPNANHVFPLVKFSWILEIPVKKSHNNTCCFHVSWKCIQLWFKNSPSGAWAVALWIRAMLALSKDPDLNLLLSSLVELTISVMSQEFSHPLLASMGTVQHGTQEDMWAKILRFKILLKNNFSKIIQLFYIFSFLD